MKDNPPSANGGPPPQPAANGQPPSGAATTNGAAHAAPPQTPQGNGHAGHGVPAAANGSPQTSHLPSTNGAHSLPSAPAQPAQHMPAPQQPAQPAPGYLPAVDEATYVMQGFQSVMGKFLDTQRSVMMAYLQGGEGDSHHASHAAHPTHAVHPAMPMPQPMHYPMPQQPMPQQPQQYAPAPQQPQPQQPAPQPAAPAPQPQAEAPAAPQPAAAEPKEPQTAMTTPNEPVQKPVAQPQAEKAGGVPSREEMAEQLLELVSGRTGYPKEMLGLDLDLEGELGIDSIKRVEILGTLAEGLGTGDEEDMDSKLDLEQLTSLRTLRGILDYLDEALANPPQPAPSVEDVAGTPNDNGTGHAEGNGTPGTTHQAESAAVSGGDEHLEVMRGLVRLIDAPLPSGAGAVVPTGTVVVTDDGRGVALELASRLADFDVNVTIVRMAAPGAKGWTADLTDPIAVAELIGRIREEAGPIGGLIHLMPLAEREPGDDWLAQAHRDTKSLYLLARELQPDLQAVGEDGGALMIVATALGGTLGFGEEPLPESFSPAAGGVMGFAKSFSLEAPEIMVRIVDLAPQEAAGDLADHVLAELNDPEGPLEIGHRGTQRVTWQPYKATLDCTGEPKLSIPDGATILVTGGARGITARIVEELAHRHKPNVVLVGRSPLPPETEDPETAGLEGQAEIKAVFIKRLQAAGAKFLPADVEKQYQRLLQDREIRGNLQRIRAAGATVHYRQVDVRDEAGMTALFAELKETFGGVDGVIHGAGIIDDKLVKDKTLESFDRVFGTKVDSAALIARHLDPERLKFCVLFASIASRYGNRGQSDYAAANEVLSKLARQLNERTDGRVTAVCWGPWGGIGMVSHLEKHMVKRGLKLIPPAVGAKMLADELLYGSKEQTEVLIAGGEEHEMTPRHSRQRIGMAPAPASAGT